MADTPKLLAEWFWTDRWTGSSAFTLSIEARGLYREMLTQAWRRGARLPNDHEAIRRVVGCTKPEWNRCWPKIEPYWRVDGDGLVNDTQVGVYHQAESKRERASARGTAGAVKRWKQKPDGMTRQQRIDRARTKGTHTEEQWIKLVRFCGKKCLKCGSDGFITKDHIQGLAAGGSDGIDNIQPLCDSCNCGKSDAIDYRQTIPGFPEFLAGLMLTHGSGNAKAIRKHKTGNAQAMPKVKPPSPISDLSSESKEHSLNGAGDVSEPMPPEACEGESDGSEIVNVGAFIGEFCRLYAKHRHGAKYHVKREKHAPLVKSLLKTYGHERLSKLAVILFTTDDEWISNSDRGIGILSTKVSWLDGLLSEHEARKGERVA